MTRAGVDVHAVADGRRRFLMPRMTRPRSSLGKLRAPSVHALVDLHVLADDACLTG